MLIDMNLTPAWVEFFAQRGIESVHWSTIGDPRANDSVIMDYAREAGFVVFTHDLDFGNVLAVTHARGPSVSDQQAHGDIMERRSVILSEGMALAPQVR